MRTINWLNYDALYKVIRSRGFAEKPLASGGTLFVHPNSAELSFPARKPDEPVHRLHYGATVTVMTNYGIMTRDAFELALLQAAHQLPTPA